LHPTTHDDKQTNLIEMRTPYSDQSQASFKGSIMMMHVLTAPIFAIDVDIYRSKGKFQKAIYFAFLIAFSKQPIQH
jgi:hypothetical protein